MRRSLNNEQIRYNTVIETIWKEFPNWKEDQKHLGFKDMTYYSLVCQDQFSDLSALFLQWCIDSLIWHDLVTQEKGDIVPIGGSGLLYAFQVPLPDYEWKDFVMVYDPILIPNSPSVDDLPLRIFKNFGMSVTTPITTLDNRNLLTMNCSFHDSAVKINDPYFELSSKEILFIEQLLEKAFPVWILEHDLAEKDLSPDVECYTNDAKQLVPITRFHFHWKSLKEHLQAHPERVRNHRHSFNIVYECLRISKNTILHLQSEKHCAFSVGGIILYVHDIQGQITIHLQSAFAKERLDLVKGQCFVWPFRYSYQFTFSNTAWANLTIIHILEWQRASPKICRFYPFIRDEYVKMFLQLLEAHFTKFVHNNFRDFALQMILPKMTFWKFTEWKDTLHSASDRHCFTLL